MRRKEDAMAEHARGPIPGWHYGVDPWAAGLTILSIGRADHPLGDALRLEMTSSAAEPAPVHVQWYIATSVGPWALWTACEPGEVGACEAVLREVTWFGPEGAGEPLAEVRV
jgi:hypothetical protein